MYHTALFLTINFGQFIKIPHNGRLETNLERFLSAFTVLLFAHCTCISHFWIIFSVSEYCYTTLFTYNMHSLLATSYIYINAYKLLHNACFHFPETPVL